MLCFHSNVFDATLSLGSVITLDVLLLLKCYTKQTRFFLSCKCKRASFQCASNVTVKGFEWKHFFSRLVQCLNAEVQFLYSVAALP